MAPTKATSSKTTNQIFLTKNRITTRLSSKPSANATNITQARVKRKADASPVKEIGSKRSALGDVTNQKKTLDIKTKKTINNAIKKVTVQTKVLPSVKTVIKPKHNENLPPQAPGQKIQTRASLKNVDINSTAQKPVKEAKTKTRLSNEFEKSGDSLYSSALEDISDTSRISTGPPVTRSQRGSGDKSANVTLVAQQLQAQLNLGNHEVPKGVVDFDKENWNDIFQVSHYTMDIFNYLKSREALFTIKDYMDTQICLTRWMRSLLVDWMVEVQESFELNHETLYLAVKLVDYYLSKVIVSKETLQLVGAASMLIASKYDERIPPLIDDFLYICDGAYTRKELTRMEINILRITGFNLGFPLSYRFLRRYARCAKVSMPVLTLARFILEYSLMDYATVMLSDSKLAAAALYLALQMKKVQTWNATLEFYSGYKLNEIISIVHLLNTGLHRKPKEQLMTVRNKYSHKIFFEVAKTPLVKPEDLR
ncbi:hypothetical protein RN001_007210 [Aquatica leii]|uniref:G2/mitotic-specific cyclin-B3 n=1 Tax=Aquatica leii TaxID=1421715 RepID=A0AAN7PW38_9COLE|nr:hypothetical protein RN001_007210 [Aquatica leii]